SHDRGDALDGVLRLPLLALDGAVRVVGMEEDLWLQAILAEPAEHTRLNRGVKLPANLGRDAPLNHQRALRKDAAHVRSVVVGVSATHLSSPSPRQPEQFDCRGCWCLAPRGGDQRGLTRAMLRYT